MKSRLVCLKAAHQPRLCSPYGYDEKDPTSLLEVVDRLLDTTADDDGESGDPAGNGGAGPTH
ncbi:Hypothetical protein A7982_07916 [Minicystis rosea]|nr:Hypothetical protein A7982_07916 [Minicystis rosea]